MLLRHPISNIPDEELCTEDIQDYVNDLVSEGYALTTIRKQYFLIRAYLKFSLVIGRIHSPIHQAVRLPAESVVKSAGKKSCATRKTSRGPFYAF